MAVTSNRSVVITFTGEVEYTQEFAALTNSGAVGSMGEYALSSGNNTITVPSGSTAVTIIPPEDNEVVLKIKGVNGDTGIIISPDSFTSLGLDGVSSFVINAGSSVTVRLIFS